MQHIIENSRYVYYGYIKPSDDHLKKFEKILNLKDIKLKLFFLSKSNKDEMQNKIYKICNLKETLIKNNDMSNLPYINELLLFIIRFTICDFLKKKKIFLFTMVKGEIVILMRMKWF